MKRALIVGIDHYDFGQLNGCVADAKKMKEVLSTNDDDSNPFNFKCELLTSENQDITCEKLAGSIQKLLRDEAEVIETAIFYFSGHGYENNLDGYLVTPDAKKYNEGFRMQDLIAHCSLSRIREIILILDCCHAGILGNLQPNDNSMATLRKGVSIITASGASQKAVEKDGQGLFTSIIYNALKGGAADILGNVTVASVYNYADNMLGAFDQRPVFKSHVSKMTRIRKAQPKVSISQLQRLYKLFANSEFYFSLDPSYEPEALPLDSKNEEVFGFLQKMRAAGLVYPVGEEHMYDAAMKSKPCALTQLGQFYWKLVKKEHLY